MLRTAILAVVMLGVTMQSNAGLMTYDITAITNSGYTPNPANINITLDFDFSTTVLNQTAGLTVNSVNFAIDEPVGFNYFKDTDSLLFGGVPVSTSSLNDFRATILSASVAPTAGRFAIVQNNERVLTDISELEVTNEIPEPATFALFGLGLAGLGWSRRKKV